MTAPKPASVADHEASHAVVWWWWWASQPEARDPGTGRNIWRITIEPEEGKEGCFEPDFLIYTNQTSDDKLCLKHECATGLAGPISDKMRKEKRPLHPSDERKVERLANRFWPSSPEEADRFLADLRPKVELFLKRPDVCAMVKGLKKALLERKTLGHDDAVAAMEAARLR